MLMPVTESCISSMIIRYLLLIGDRLDIGEESTEGEKWNYWRGGSLGADCCVAHRFLFQLRLQLLLLSRSFPFCK